MGGGKQSIAMCVLITQGHLPKPDRIVIADTGREASSTWEYLEQHIQPLLKPHGLQVEIAPRTLATVDLAGHNGQLLMPLWTRQNGDVGKMPTFCSNEWKGRVVRRYLRKTGVKQADCWLGFTTDEITRVKPSGQKWFTFTWPLIYDLGLSRDDCIALVRDAGLPEPKKSSCWMCPLRNDHEWRQLRDEYPQDWQDAIALEKELQAKDPHVYLHHTGIPLEMAPLTGRDDAAELQCSLGFCFV